MFNGINIRFELVTPDERANVPVVAIFIEIFSVKQIEYRLLGCTHPNIQAVIEDTLKHNAVLWSK